MTKSEFKFDEIILEKRGSDPTQPAAGKFSLYNKNGGAYIRDGDNGAVAMLSSSSHAFAYIGTGSIIAGTTQWNITLPTGYIELELLLKLQVNTVTTRSLRIRFDDVSAANSYRYQYLYNNAGTPAGLTTSLGTFIQLPNLVCQNDLEPVHDWTTLHIFNYESSSEATIVHAIGHNTNNGYGALGSGGQAVGFIETSSTINLFPNADAFGNCVYHMWGKKAV